MKFFIHLFLLYIVVSPVLTACNKDSAAENNYLRGKIDGVAFECTANITANKPERIPPNDDPTIRINGEWGGYSIKLYINELFTSLTEMTYVFEAGKNRSITITENGTPYYAGSSVCLSCNTLHGTGKITLLKITKKSIQGTFETTTEPVTGVSKTITNGEFSISRE